MEQSSEFIIPDNINETLNGGYLGLVGEVVTHDCYRLKSLDFVPDTVLDLGGNVGVFARYCRDLYPEALIVSVEPHPENRATYKKFTDDSRIILIEKAIGTGIIRHDKGAANGSGEVYLSSGLGYPESEMGFMEKFDIDTVMPDELIKKYKPQLVKIDVEGNEHAIFTHEPSMLALRNIDYICMEVHFYALHGGLSQEVREKTIQALDSFKGTHDCLLDGVHFYARKKN